MSSFLLFMLRRVSRWPLSRVQLFGGILGRVVYYWSSRYRRLLSENMGLALGSSGKTLEKSAADHAGRTMLELTRIWLRPLPEVVSEVVEVRGREHIEAARALQRGLIFLTPHLGCFEITAQYLSTLFPITVLYRAPKQALLDTLMRNGRKRDALHLAPADRSGVKALIKALRKNEAIGLLPDQVPSAGEGVWQPFFGRFAYTMSLSARLTETGSPVLLIVGERLPNGRGYIIHVSPPRCAIEGDTDTRVQCIARNMEALILDWPEQYLWGYNRYKRPRGAEAPPSASGELASEPGSSSSSSKEVG